MTEPLPDAVRSRVVGLVADAIGRMEPEHLPASLKRVAAFAPARRARLAGTQIAGVLARDEGFRERVAVQVRAEVPDLARALDPEEREDREDREGQGDTGDTLDAEDTGHTGHAGRFDPVDLAAVAYLLRPEGWADVVSAAADASAAGSGDARPDRVDRLTEQLAASTEQLKDARRRHREQVLDLKSQNADLRRKLGEARTRARSAESQAQRAADAAQEAVSAAAARSSEQEAELRRLRARTEQVERELAALRRVERTGRGTETMRARLLLDTLLETAQGLRRELALPAISGSPADAVEALAAEHGTRESSGQASLRSEDPALLDQLLALPRAHLIVDGYNVTKTAWPELSLERQRDRLLRGLAPVAARNGAEVTVVFDAADATERPLVNRPRGVRVLFSSPGVIADDVIRELVEAEPRGRPVVVVSSDAEVVRDVLRAGARTAAAPALSRLLARA